MPEQNSGLCLIHWNVQLSSQTPRTHSQWQIQFFKLIIHISDGKNNEDALDNWLTTLSGHNSQQCCIWCVAASTFHFHHPTSCCFCCRVSLFLAAAFLSPIALTSSSNGKSLPPLQEVVQGPSLAHSKMPKQDRVSCCRPQPDQCPN